MFIRTWKKKEKGAFPDNPNLQKSLFYKKLEEHHWKIEEHYLSKIVPALCYDFQPTENLGRMMELILVIGLSRSDIYHFWLKYLIEKWEIPKSF